MAIREILQEFICGALMISLATLATNVVIYVWLHLLKEIKEVWNAYRRN